MKRSIVGPVFLAFVTCLDNFIWVYYLTTHTLAGHVVGGRGQFACCLRISNWIFITVPSQKGEGRKMDETGWKCVQLSENAGNAAWYGNYMGCGMQLAPSMQKHFARSILLSCQVGNGKMTEEKSQPPFIKKKKTKFSKTKTFGKHFQVLRKSLAICHQ